MFAANVVITHSKNWELKCLLSTLSVDWGKHQIISLGSWINKHHLKKTLMKKNIGKTHLVSINTWTHFVMEA